MSTPMTKICACCKEEKPTSEFYKRYDRKDGLRSQCKKCKNVKRSSTRKDQWKNTPYHNFAGRIHQCLKRKPAVDPINQGYLLNVWKSQQGKCALTGIEMVWGGDGKGGNGKCRWNSISIDRIDNSVGYEKGNVRLICQCVNAFLMDMKDEEMVKVTELLLKGLKNEEK